VLLLPAATQRVQRQVQARGIWEAAGTGVMVRSPLLWLRWWQLLQRGGVRATQVWVGLPQSLQCSVHIQQASLDASRCCAAANAGTHRVQTALGGRLGPCSAGKLMLLPLRQSVPLPACCGGVLVRGSAAPVLVRPHSQLAHSDTAVPGRPWLARLLHARPHRLEAVHKGGLPLLGGVQLKRRL
jgi:hypothetical protein